MAIKTFFINSTVASYTDEEFAWFQSLMLNEGVIGDPATGVIGLQVIQAPVPDMTVKVGVGRALVELVKSGRTFKVVVHNDAEVSVVIPANATGINRVDAIIVRVDKDVDPNISKTNVSTIERVAGTGATALTDGYITTAVGSDGWYRLANVTVANADTSIITAEIANTSIKVAFNNGMAFSPIFITSSVGAADAGKVPTLNALGFLDKSFGKQPVKRIYTLNNVFGTSTTRFDITNPSGTTFRYTYDATGTDPTINATTVPIGTELYINGQNFAAGNKGAFVVTGSGANYFEITNPLGVVEADKTLGTGAINYCYIPTPGVSYIEVTLIGAGAGGGGGSGGAGSGGAGGGGGIAKKRILSALLSSFNVLVVGKNGLGGGASAPGTAGTSTTLLGVTAGGGSGGLQGSGSTPGANGSVGVATNGDENYNGGLLGLATSGAFVGLATYGNGGGGGNSTGSAGLSGYLVIDEFFL